MNQLLKSRYQVYRSAVGSEEEKKDVVPTIEFSDIMWTKES